MRRKDFQCQEHSAVTCSFGIMENLMTILFSHISSDESTLDQRNNKQSTNQQPKKGEDQKSRDSTKHETTLCATCK